MSFSAATTAKVGRLMGTDYRLNNVISPRVRLTIWFVGFAIWTYLLVVPVDWLPAFLRGTGPGTWFSFGKLGHAMAFATLTASCRSRRRAFGPTRLVGLIVVPCFPHRVHSDLRADAHGPMDGRRHRSLRDPDGLPVTGRAAVVATEIAGGRAQAIRRPRKSKC